MSNNFEKAFHYNKVNLSLFKNLFLSKNILSIFILFFRIFNGVVFHDAFGDEDEINFCK